MSDTDPTGSGPASAGSRCPMCGKPTQAATRPFCSKRCADLDLSRWLNGVYAIPAAEESEDDEDAPPRPGLREG